MKSAHWIDDIIKNNANPSPIMMSSTPNPNP